MISLILICSTTYTVFMDGYLQRFRSWYSKLSKVVSYDKKQHRRFLAAAICSASFSTFFPLVTQIFLEVGYPSNDIQVVYVIAATVLFAYLGFLLLDIYTQKSRTKYFLKLEKHIQEQLYESLRKKTKAGDTLPSQDTLHELYITKSSHYIHYIRGFLLENILNFAKLCTVMILLYLTNDELFVQAVVFVPMLIVYLVFFSYLMKTQSAGAKKYSLNAVLRQISQPSDVEYQYKSFRRALATTYEREHQNRTRLVSLHQVMNYSITVFRVGFLTYYGYFIITQQAPIGTLIVGLLYLTILWRISIRALRSLTVPIITRDSREDIHQALR